MKETVNVNIGSEAFILDEDACRVLRNYFEDIRSRLADDADETMGDIERGMAEILREKVSSPMRVISLETVRAAMARMGSPADFGERRDGTEAQKAAEEEPRRLYRSRTNHSIAGVCAGVAEFFDADPTLIRLVTLLLILFGGLSIWVYILLWIIIPEAPARKYELKNKKR